MPIYAYRCESCGHAQDVLQKMSDPVLTVCPSCGQATYAKQLTAAGFQLKGSGWYVTDFRGGNTPAKKEGESDKPADAKPADAKSGEAKPPSDAKPGDAKAAPAAAATTPAPAPAPPPAASSAGS
jgi:putative FmdB family regulatory protein